MNLISVLKELWRRRLLVAGAAIVAALVAVLSVYSVALWPPALSKQDHREAHGSIEILIDSVKSPIADVDRELEPLTARAGVFARYIAGGTAIKQIAKDTGIPAKEIEVAGPVPLPGEAPGAGEAPPNLLPYGVEVLQGEELPIVNVYTRAPTTREARELAAAAPPAIRQIIASIQRRQEIPDSKRIIFRALGPAQASETTEAAGAKIAALLYVVLFALLVLLILAVPRLLAAWRVSDPDSAKQPSRPQPQARPPTPLASVLPAAKSNGPRALASASIAAADEIERAQLEVSSRSEDG